MRNPTLSEGLAEAERLDRTGSTDDAERLLAELAAAWPDSAEPLRRLAGFALRRRDYPAARRSLETAASLAPTDASMLLTLATLYDRMGAPRLAEAASRRVLDLSPSEPGALCLIAKLATPGSDETELLPAIEAALLQPGLFRQERAALGFAAGRILHLAGRPQEAFSHFSAANAATPVKNDAAGREAFATRLEAAFADFEWPSFTPPARLALIAGLPHAGGDYLAGVLGAHPEAALIEDADRLAEAAAGLGTFSGVRAQFPENAPHLTHEAWAAASDAFFARLREDCGPAPLYVISTPAGFLLAGIAAALAPGALVIDLARPALASALATFMDPPGVGGAYGHSVNGIGRHFRLYRRTMAFWAGTLPAGPITIDADAMVLDPAPVAERILAAADLEMEPDCLARIDRTLPAARYGDDLGRDGWRAYAPHLGALRRAIWPP